MSFWNLNFKALKTSFHHTVAALVVPSHSDDHYPGAILSLKADSASLYMIVSESTLVLVGILRLFSYIQVAAAVAVLYDHALTFAREIEYIWVRRHWKFRPRPTYADVGAQAEAAFISDHLVSVASALICASRELPRQTCALYNTPGSFLLLISWALRVFQIQGFRLFQVRAWGTLVYSWLTQCIMQLRIYAIEVFVVVFIIWRTIGTSKLVVDNEPYPGTHLCSFSGINRNFTYLFIPVLCFEVLLFVLAIQISLRNMRNTKGARGGASGLRVDSFMSILVRDSILYFFINLALCAVIMGIWRNITAMRANITIPFVMLVEIVIGTRMVINLKEHCDSRRLSVEPIMWMGGTESIRFAVASRETARLSTIREGKSMKGDEELQPMKDEDSDEIIAYEELSSSVHAVNMADN
ncbi:putative protein 30 [Rhizopogon vesiculosus]|uniref:DUF6533 domain-containing protein n=1 Tax=Rhizopogon vesiculosus TaxID=180088 RepID=A0A1J8QJ62_9AGAM|nr:putative protein 30 [Rhizopogon vesiculosus]